MSHTPDDAVTEIRFAVVLNGGVSLAVWMGGVVLELDELIRQGDAVSGQGAPGNEGSHPGQYGGLMRLFGIRARADVISGTSAGGINGAALALSQVNRNADISMLREMWAEQGRMETLLQRPFKGSPASLLRGDDYFLPKLTEAMQRLTRDWEPAGADVRPIDLTITTTLLEGARSVTVDSLGQRLPQLRYEGRFRFRRGAGHERDGTPYDDFSAPAATERAVRVPRDRLAERLSLAARCTASFPGAFEPTLVPVVKDASEDPRERADMSHHVNWAGAGARQEVPPDRSRFAVDGGVLANTPTRDALEAIQRMPAGNQVDRVMLLVYPHAPLDSGEPVPDLAAPTVAGTFGSLLGALLSQGSRTFVDEIEWHNQRAAARRATRTDILTVRGTGGPGAPSLYEQARILFDLYRGLRLRRAARDLSMRAQTPAQWSFERIRSAVEEAHCTLEQSPAGGDDLIVAPLPYVPARLPGRTDTQPTGTGWGWGTSTALDIADAGLDLVQRLHQDARQRDALGTLVVARRQIHLAMAEMRAARDAVDGRWDRHRALIGHDPDVTYWQLRLATYSWLMLGNAAHRARVDELAHRLVPTPAAPQAIVAAALGSDTGGSCGQTTRLAVDRVVSAVAAVGHLLDRSREPAWGAVFGDRVLPDGEARSQVILDRLLWLHVVSWTTGDETVTENTRPVNLIQISAQTRNAFAAQSSSMDEKLGGGDIARFSGFLKRSWRMNDWAWGRCDAATMLCRVLLSPERVRSLAVAERDRPAEQAVGGDQPAGDVTLETLAGRVTDRVLAAAFGLPATPAAPPWRDGNDVWAPLARQRRRAVDEVQDLLEHGLPPTPDPAVGVPADVSPATLPASLPELAALAAYARHAEIGVQELPVIAAAVRADALDGANTRSRGQLLLAQHESLLHDLGTLPSTPSSPAVDTRRVELGLRALSAFDQAGIGREPLGREGTSDQMIRTATTAASVAATLLDSPRSGLRMLKPVTRLVRGTMLVPYWVTLGLTGGGRIARFLALLALSTGGLLLALAVFGVLPGWATGVAATVGAGAVLTAFGYAALRTGTLLHGLVLLTPVLLLLASGWALLEDQPRTAGPMEPAVTAVGTVGAVILLGLGLVALGSLPAPMLSVQASFVTLVTPLAYTFVALVGVGALVAMGLRIWPGVPTWAVHLGAASLFALGTWCAWINGRALRRWRLRIPPSPGGADRVRPREWETDDVEHPLGVSAGWSALYGTGYLVAAVVVAQATWPEELEQLSAVVLATTIAFAVVLLGVVPPLARHRAVARLRTGLQAEIEAGLLIRDDVDREGLVRLLLRRDLTYQCLVTPAPEPPAAGTDPALVLTKSRARAIEVLAPSGSHLADVLTATADRAAGAARSTSASRS